MVSRRQSQRSFDLLLCVTIVIATFSLKQFLNASFFYVPAMECISDSIASANLISSVAPSNLVIDTEESQSLRWVKEDKDYFIEYTRQGKESEGAIFVFNIDESVQCSYQERWEKRNITRHDYYMSYLLKSAESLKKYSNSTHVTLLMSKSVTLPKDKMYLFDQIGIVDEVVDVSLGSKIVYMRYSPYARTVFLDSDVIVCADLNLALSILESFDLGVAWEPPLTVGGRWGRLQKQRLASKYSSNPEYNTGVVVYRLTPSMKMFLQSWIARHKQLTAKRIKERAHKEKCTSASDQDTFREMLNERTSEVRFYRMPWEFNYRANGNIVPQSFLHDVVVVHSRTASNRGMDEVCSKVNKNTHHARMFETNLDPNLWAEVYTERFGADEAK